MASRVQKKEQRKQERLEAEQTAAADERRKKLIAGVGAAALAAVIVVVALIVVSQSDDDGGGDGELTGVAEVEAELGGLDQAGTVLGDRKAEVTVVEFGDLQCPACAGFSEQVVPEVIEQAVRPGDAKIEFRNFVILGPDSDTAARAALAASEQDRYWEFVELFYRNQGVEGSGYVTDEFLTDIARGAGVPDLDAWEADRGDPRWDEMIAETEQDAVAVGFTGTPSVLVEGPGGSEALGTPGSVEEILAAIERVS